MSEFPIISLPCGREGGAISVESARVIICGVVTTIHALLCCEPLNKLYTRFAATPAVMNASIYGRARYFVTKADRLELWRRTSRFSTTLTAEGET